MTTVIGIKQKRKSNMKYYLNTIGILYILLIQHPKAVQLKLQTIGKTTPVNLIDHHEYLIARIQKMLDSTPVDINPKLNIEKLFNKKRNELAQQLNKPKPNIAQMEKLVFNFNKFRHQYETIHMELEVALADLEKMAHDDYLSDKHKFDAHTLSLAIQVSDSIGDAKLILRKYKILKHKIKEN